MRRFALVFVFVLIGALSSFGATRSTYAAGGTGTTVNWQERDTAVYVVSTLNLLTNSSGRPLVQRLHATGFDVFSDSVKQDLYFIQAHRGTTSVAVFAYQMGWLKPKVISMSVTLSRVRAASETLARSFRSDPKELIGSFTSTTPS